MPAQMRKFAKEQSRGWGCAVTAALALIMLLVILNTREVDAPVLFKVRTDRAASLVTNCLEAPHHANRLGELSKLPIANPTFDRWLHRRSELYATASGHRIVVSKGSHETLVTVRGRNALTEDQINFFRSCADPSIMW